MNADTDDKAAEREVSPFIDEVQHIRCPSCDHTSSFHDLNEEGGTQCDGCGRKIVLKITTYNQFGEWRNIPKGTEGMFR